MRFTPVLAVAGAAAVNAQALQGFNYGAGLTTGAAKTQDDFETDFRKAQNLAGTSGWNSARLYTSIQTGTTNSPIAAIPAAVATKTKLLLGMWASAGEANIQNEIAAIDAAIEQYGSSFTDLVVGLSIGSEDLYRISPTGIENMSGLGAGPDVLVNYINMVKAKNWGFSLGHVDTWTAWVNGSNQGVIDAVDWLGFDGYPYFESTLDNPITNAEQLFDQSYGATVGVAGGKAVWVTETGWPVSGPQSGQASASTQNAETYWKAVACKLIGQTNVFWYTLRDAEPNTPSPSFGIIPSDVNADPLYDLSCSASSNSTSTSSSASSSATMASMASSASAASSASVSALATQDVGQGSPGVAPLVTGSPSSSGSSGNSTGATGGSSGSGSSGSGSSGSGSSGVAYGTGSTGGAHSTGSPSGPAASATPSQYLGAASSSTGGLSAIAAIAAFIGLVAGM